MTKPLRARPWTDKEAEDARRLYRVHKKYSTVGKILGRPASSVRSRLNDAEVGERNRSIPERTIVPAFVLEDRERRYQLAPRDLTAALLGDPLPGLSALEQR